MKTYNLKPHISGTTFAGLSLQLIINGKKKDLTGASIEMRLSNGVIFSTANKKITITNAREGRFQLNKQIISMAAGNYTYTLKFTFSGGDVKVYMTGNWRIR